MYWLSCLFPCGYQSKFSRLQVGSGKHVDNSLILRPTPPIPTRVNLPLSRSAPLFFDSGLNANADFFTYVLQSSDDPFHAVAIPASVNDGARASRVAPRCAVPSCTMRCVRCALRSGPYHHGYLELLRPPRGWHSRMGTYSSPLFCYPDPLLTMPFRYPSMQKFAEHVLKHSAYLKEYLRASLAAPSILAHILTLTVRL